MESTLGKALHIQKKQAHKHFNPIHDYVVEPNSAALLPLLLTHPFAAVLHAVFVFL